jgi:hypothetical protein
VVSCRGGTVKNERVVCPASISFGQVHTTASFRCAQSPVNKTR